METLCSPQEYDKFVLDRTFVEGLLSSMMQSIGSSQSNRKRAPLQKFLYKSEFIDNATRGSSKSANSN